MSISVALRAFFLLLTMTTLGFAAPADAAPLEEEVQTSWRLLDYIAVDYREAVRDGAIVNEAEYQEMLEFSQAVGERFATLPDRQGRRALLDGLGDLRQAITAKAPEGQVADQARGLAASLLDVYPVPLAPTAPPSLSRGATLYQQQCASCHGVEGEGPSGAMATIEPPPIAFQDRERASERSIFSYYQVITQGLEETAMQSYADLSAEDRWALAFHAGTMAYGDVARGERIWREDESVRARFPDLAALAAITPAQLAEDIGAERAAAVTAFLRSKPQILTAQEPAPLDLVRERLNASLAAYGAGDADRAGDLALSAYLDGFEPIEPLLGTRDGALMQRTEQALADFRVAIARGVPAAQLEERLQAIRPLLDEAERELAPEQASAATAFLAAFAILLREGLEALLVVVAMIAFLRKAERTEGLAYVHGGWIVALLAGAATWLLATYMIDISGAGREITEGVGALLASAILVSVGIWMHGKAQADEWRRYIAAKMDRALTRGSAWFLFGLAFIVVYREAFETILFFAALWSAGNNGALIAGALTAVALLGVIAWFMIRLSRTLPITKFFAYSAALMAVLAVILAGKGIGALQEAGVIGITPLPGVPRISMLGLFPTVEAVAAQLLVFLALALGFYRASRPRLEAAPAE